MVKFTDLALKELVKAFDANKLTPPIVVRVGVRGGGCSGFTYKLDLIGLDDINQDDQKFEQENVTVIVDPKSNLYIDGTTIDFNDDLMGRGFIFSNPNSTGQCGCGSSFEA